MKRHAAFIGLTIVNLALVSLQFAKGGPEQSIPTVVRARSFELVDDNGRLRAELKVTPAQPNFKMPDGTVGYPEAVLLRLIDSKNGPNVKIVATEDGAGMSLGGEKGYVQLLSRTEDPFVKIVTKDGRENSLQTAPAK